MTSVSYIHKLPGDGDGPQQMKDLAQDGFPVEEACGCYMTASTQDRRPLQPKPEDAERPAHDEPLLHT